MKNKLTGPAPFNLRPISVMVQRAVEFQMLDTRLGLVHLMPGDYVVTLPNGEQLGVAAADIDQLALPHGAAAEDLRGAAPIDLTVDAYPIGRAQRQMIDQGPPPAPVHVQDNDQLAHTQQPPRWMRMADYLTDRPGPRPAA